MENIDRLAAMISEGGGTVFFGGAGVSTESGLKDYRSEDGIYNTVTDYGCSPEEILSADFFHAHTETFYRFYRDYFLGEARPNRAHRALAKLEDMGLVSAVVTQNVDGLHTAAGSRNVTELHGTVEDNCCLRCGRRFDRSYIRNYEGTVPLCPCGGILKPKVTLYGEALDGEVCRRAAEAISRCNTLIVGGTSLTVYPAASFLGYFRGKNLAVINRESTPRDKDADLVFRESIGGVFDELMGVIGNTRGR